MRKESGFTLMELMVGVAIVAICAGTAIPSFVRLAERQRSSTAMNGLITQMGAARMAAIAHRQAVVLCPSADGVTCRAGTDWSGGSILFLDRDADRAVDPDDVVLRSEMSSASSALLVRSTTGRPALRYLPDGRAAGTNLTISICNRSGELLGSVIVNNVGRPRSERPRTPTACPR